MPILRKIIRVGNSKAVVIPSEWLEFYKKQFGKDLEEVGMEVNNVITISPLPAPEGSEEPLAVETVSPEAWMYGDGRFREFKEKE